MPDSYRPSPASHRMVPGRFLRLGLPCLLVLAMVNGVVLWRLHDRIFEGYADFASFYTAGMMVRTGQAARLYEPALQWQLQQQFASRVEIRRGPLPYVRPPFEAILFLPLAYLSYPAAFVLWLTFKVCLLLVLPFLLPGSYNRAGSPGIRVLRGLACLAFFPAGFDMVQGQDSILLLFVMALAFRLLLRGADLGCGAVLALGLFKFHIVIPILLVFAMLRRGKIVVAFAITAFSLFLISLTMVRWSGILGYPRYLWILNRIPGLGMVSEPERMPNIRGVLTVLLGKGALPAGAHWFLGGIVALGVAIAAVAWRGYRSTPVAFSFSLVLVLLTSYYANIYDLTLLLLPLLLLGESVLTLGSAGWPRFLFLGSFALLFCTPALWLLALRVNLFFWLALVLLALAGSLSAMGKKGQVTDWDVDDHITVRL